MSQIHKIWIAIVQGIFNYIRFINRLLQLNHKDIVVKILRMSSFLCKMSKLSLDYFPLSRASSES